MLHLQTMPAPLLTSTQIAPLTPVPMMPGPSMASPLMLCDRLLSLAQDADRAGHAVTADHLIRLAHAVLDEPVTRHPS